jgi:hypothetical protein
MDNRDFLDGIDDQFQRLMRQQGSNGKGNGRTRSQAPEQSVTSQIMDKLAHLSHTQREEVLAFIQSLKQKIDE